MLYVELVLAPRGEVVSINPIQVMGVKSEDDDHALLLMAAGEFKVFGRYSLVLGVLSGDEQAVEEYDKKWVIPARKEGPRTMSGAILLGNGAKKP